MRKAPAMFALATVLSISGRTLGQGDDLSKMIDRAESAPIDQQPRLSIEIAERELQVADQLYSADQVEKARVAVGNVVIYADKASEAAIQSGKRLKDTEIALRKMSLKLRDMKHKLSIDDQGPVQDASDHLEALRTNLLAYMFKKNK